MAVNVMSNVWKNSQQKANKLLLLLALADSANDEGWTYPSQKTLAEKCRLGIRAVQKLLDALEDEGEIVIHNRRVNDSDQHLSNVYHLAKYGVADSHAPVDLKGELRKRITSGTGVANSDSLPSEQRFARGSEQTDSRVANSDSHESLQEPSVEPSRTQMRSQPAASTASQRPPQTYSHSADLEGYNRRFDYYHAYEAGFPDHARVKVADTRTNKEHARQVYLATYSLDEVTDLVRSKIAQGKTDYRFHYLMADLAQARLERNRNAPVAPPKYHRASDELIAQLEKGGYQRVH